ncbi:MAG: helix-turn-helix transcriptional regulator, partial [Bacteroidales bacterium]|nr:helix-turn-helix transcriptional regulator [Bacteroidales bacterium]
MKERILEFLKSENKTSAQFAEEIGVQPSGISHILSGRNKPSL